MMPTLQSLANRIEAILVDYGVDGSAIRRCMSNELVTLLEEKFPQPDEPKCEYCKHGCTFAGNNPCACPCHTKSDEPKCCEKCDGKEKRGQATYLKCIHPYCPCHKPHWESDYAAIWERDLYDPIVVRQDILELIKGLMK